MSAIQILIALVLIAVTDCKQPNILLIVSDDYGFHDIGYHGSEIKTPNLDYLAKTGVKLENYYVQPICTPTRSQLLSGRYQIHTGLQHDIVWPPQPNGLPLNDPTIADKLKAAGYSTHAVGKWHIGFYKKEYVPTSRGFDSYYGYLGGGEDYYTHYESYNSKLGGYDLRAGMDPVTTENGSYSTHLFTRKVVDIVEHHDTDKNGWFIGYLGGGEDYYTHYYSYNSKLGGYDLRAGMDPVTTENGSYSTHLFTRKVIDIVEHHDTDKPLFIYLPYQAVHDPMQVPEEYMKPYQHIENKYRRIYAGMVSCMDEGIGNITEAMKRAGLWDNTILAFTTDNGGQVYAGGNNWPLRGWKRSLWEGGIRGVGFIHSNLLDSSVVGTSSHDLMHVTDWFPTLVTLAGGNLNGTNLDGFNQWSTINKISPNPRTELLHNIDPLWPAPKDANPVDTFGDTFNTSIRAALRMGPWKIITGDPGNGSWIPPPDMNWDPISPPANDDNVWLFNIETDPTEHDDLSGDVMYRDIVKQMLDRLLYYQKTSVPVRYPPVDPRSDPRLHGDFWGPWL